ncbi:hypothetical protein EYE40_05060 [Glaciihabitans arcticus]|uniref:Uncharacterized protein n=1 Tax=Glaciihabitans arcticus TaxID=2668039 RepID=A0A4Q9GT62_9MICO|nr:hypothetical protein [Glaciihabitans arcticus]TBN56818.1 hypothetical protein EYE40_05060 [Glaciihabitans arcticus]
MSGPLLPITRRNVIRGGAWTVLFFSTSVTIGFAIFSAIDSATRPHGGWGIGVVVLILVIGFPLAIITGAVVALVFGVPLALLSGYLLRRVSSPAFHALGAGIIGAVLATAVGLLVGQLLPGLLAVLIVAGGLSGAGGWLMARRGQVHDENEQRLRATLGESF